MLLLPMRAMAKIASRHGCSKHVPSPQILFETLGCRLNQIESEAAARFFSDAGFAVTMDVPNAASEKLDSVLLCVVNTCAVTQKAEQKARRVIRLLLEKCPNASVAVTGCYAELAQSELELLDWRVAALPGLCKSRLADVPALLAARMQSEPRTRFDALAFSELLRSSLFAAPTSHADGGKYYFSEDAFRLSTDTFLAHSRASLKIQDGCNCACSYCAIRLARGKSVSLPVRDVVARVQELIAAGQKEVVLTAVNLAQYRGEYDGAYCTFADLLEKLLRETSGIAFRISSLYPEIIDERFCAIVKDERVRPHFHLSVQSGSDAVLQAMKRNYCAEDVARSVALLRSAKESAFFACDIIAGFPEESDDDFDKTLALCRACNFSYVHAFPFSARPGTEAFAMKQKIPERIKKARVKTLASFAHAQKIAYIDSWGGKTVRAIAENAKPGEKEFRAMTENFLHCAVASSTQELPKAGSEVRVRIVRPLVAAIERGEELEAAAELV